MCEKFKAMRAEKTLLHKTSRKNFACLEEELKEQSEMPDAISRSDVWIHAYEAKEKKGSNEVVEDPEIVKQVKMYKAEQEPSQKCSLKDDAVAKVIGPDPRGRVRGLGFEAAPSKADYQTNVGNKVTKLENALLAQAQDMLSQSQEIQRLKEMVGTLFARSDNGVNNHDKDRFTQHGVHGVKSDWIGLCDKAKEILMEESNVQSFGFELGMVISPATPFVWFSD